jgi:hypothetical protein
MIENITMLPYIVLFLNLFVETHFLPQTLNKCFSAEYMHVIAYGYQFQSTDILFMGFLHYSMSKVNLCLYMFALLFCFGTNV